MSRYGASDLANANNDTADCDGDARTDEGETDDVEIWMNSPFAVGYTKATWADEKIGCCDVCASCYHGSQQTHVHCTAFFCGWLGCGRLGNMVVLRQKMEKYGDQINEDGDHHRRPRVKCIVGPYWYIMTFCTTPFLFILAIGSGYSRLFNHPWYITLVWALVNGTLLLALFNVSCRDPGVIYRHREAPTERWIWNDQAKTFRPPNAMFDSECACVIENFDHTCPWTGTAIGKGNMCWFRIFLGFLVLAIVFDAGLLVYF